MTLYRAIHSAPYAVRRPRCLAAGEVYEYALGSRGRAPPPGITGKQASTVRAHHTMLAHLFESILYFRGKGGLMCLK